MRLERSIQGRLYLVKTLKCIKALDGSFDCIGIVSRVISLCNLWINKDSSTDYAEAFEKINRRPLDTRMSPHNLLQGRHDFQEIDFKKYGIYRTNY